MASAAQRRIKSISYAKYGYMFIAPFFLVYAFFQVWPLINTFLLSFHGNGGDNQPFVGLENYQTLLFGGDDRRTRAFNVQFFQAFKNTIILWIGNFIPQIFLSLLLAVWFTDSKLHIPGKGAFKVIPDKHCPYEIDFEDSDWEEDLEIAMCKAFLQFYPLGSTFTKEAVDNVFHEIVGIRFNRIANIEYWILEKLQTTKENLPDFVIQESEINEEIRQGKTDVDYVLDGTFGEGVLNKQYPDFSVTYLMTNHNQMIITDARWN